MTHSPTPRFAVIGPGRLGTALHRTLIGAGFIAGGGPLGRGSSAPEADVVILCVPDRAITEAASKVASGSLVVHTSGASSLDLLSAHPRRGVLHPLLSVPSGDTDLRGAAAAVRASDPRDEALLRELVIQLGMTPLAVSEADRTAYHAAATLASNAVVALHVAAAELAATAGVPASALGPLALASTTQVTEQGSAALTGPAARGDWDTVDAQRAAIQQRTPHLLPLFDAATEACARIAGQTRPSSPTTSVASEQG